MLGLYTIGLAHPKLSSWHRASYTVLSKSLGSPDYVFRYFGSSNLFSACVVPDRKADIFIVK